MAAAGKSRGVFIASIMIGHPHVTAAVPRLIRVEVSERLRAAFRKWPVIPMASVPAVVHMANKARRAVEPGAGANEYSTDEPIRPIVAIGRAVVWRVIEVPVRTDRRRPNIDADADLGRRVGYDCAKEARETQQAEEPE
jgi:hypothetical protein